ncbi:MAG: hypothetical protein KAR31_06490, partial [Candidatus Omnitrophica bacterium]|nr:hypothetical protein [Candidatus Omnitrophota bacterium]
DNGPEAMPGELPATTGYTYAVELSADEAIAAGAKKVEFNQPLYFYVENFLGFPTGIAVPVGYYDKTQAAWVPSDDGKVIEILSTVTGFAEIDLDGSGIAADAAALSALGITDEERVQLASLYAPGQSLWRAPVEHFTPFDCNWPVALLPGSNAPAMDDAQTVEDIDDPRCSPGSIIECENQILRERVDVTGTPFSLNYQSSRVVGRRNLYQLEIFLSDDTPPLPLKRIRLEINIAGRTFNESFPPDPNQIYTFSWDGKDFTDRTLQGKQPVNIRIGYVYDSYYAYPSSLAKSFGFPNGTLVPGPISARRERTFWQNQSNFIGAWDVRSQGLGAWTLSEHHFYDPIGKIIHHGYGGQRRAENIDYVVTTVAGNGLYGGPTGSSVGDGKPATEAKLYSPSGVAVSPDGSLYIADTFNNRIRKVDTSGIITTVAGTGLPGYSGNGVLATTANLYLPRDVAIGPDGSLYIADTSNNRIRKVDTDGIITTVMGTGGLGFPIDGELAVNSKVQWPYGVVIGPDNNMYVVGSHYQETYRVDPGGIVTKLLGRGEFGIAAGHDNSIYVSEAYNQRVLRVDANRNVTVVAGIYRAGGYNGDQGLATESRLNYPHGITIREDGSLFIADTTNNRIRRVNSNGIISTIAGNGSAGFRGDGGPAAAARINGPNDITISPDGSLYIADTNNHRIRRVDLTFPGYNTQNIVIASKDGNQVYHFDPNGRHQRTVNALTG